MAVRKNHTPAFKAKVALAALMGDRTLAELSSEAEKASFKEHTFSPARTSSSVNVKAIRTALALSQVHFASSFGLPLSSVRHWEEGKGQPDPAACAYLTVIAKAPHVVLDALRGAP